MLEENRFESLSDNSVLLLYAEESEDVAVLGDDLVRFHRIAEVLAIVHDW